MARPINNEKLQQTLSNLEAKVEILATRQKVSLTVTFLLGAAVAYLLAL